MKSQHEQEQVTTRMQHQQEANQELERQRAAMTEQYHIDLSAKDQQHQFQLQNIQKHYEALQKENEDLRTRLAEQQSNGVPSQTPPNTPPKEESIAKPAAPGSSTHISSSAGQPNIAMEGLETLTAATPQLESAAQGSETSTAPDQQPENVMEDLETVMQAAEKTESSGIRNLRNRLASNRPAPQSKTQAIGIAKNSAQAQTRIVKNSSKSKTGNTDKHKSLREQEALRKAVEEAEGGAIKLVSAFEVADACWKMQRVEGFKKIIEREWTCTEVKNMDGTVIAWYQRRDNNRLFRAEVTSGDLTPGYRKRFLREPEENATAAELEQYKCMCIFAQLPEAQIEAAERSFVARPQLISIFRQRLLKQYGACTVCEEKAKFPELWESTVAQLAEMEEFGYACGAYLANKPRMANAGAWPARFRDPRIIYDTSIQREKEVPQDMRDYSKSNKLKGEALGALMGQFEQKSGFEPADEDMLDALAKWGRKCASKESQKDFHD